MAAAAGSAPEHQGTEASKSPQPKPRERQEQKASRERRKQADGSSRCSCPSIPVKLEAPVLRAWGLAPKASRGGRLGSTGGLVPASRAPAWPLFQGSHPRPALRGCRRGHGPNDPGQRGLGWAQSCQQGLEALGPGEAAHLAVAGARLVHEGAVLTGPHGGRGGMRGAPDSAVLMEARELYPDCACGWGEKPVSITSAQEDFRPLGLCYARQSESRLCSGRQQMWLEDPASPRTPRTPPELLSAELQGGGATHSPPPSLLRQFCVNSLIGHPPLKMNIWVTSSPELL